MIGETMPGAVMVVGESMEGAGTKGKQSMGRVK